MNRLYSLANATTLAFPIRFAPLLFTDLAVLAALRIDEIDRAACRAAVAARFTVDRMVDRYLSLYRTLLG